MNDKRSQALADWRRIRRHAVPRWMIEQATEHRLAGDWKGACRAARVRVEVDLADLPGPEVRDAVEDDLRHFAPDLLRWHLPRFLSGRTTIRPHQALVLARYGDLALHVVTPTMIDGPQHLILRLGEVDER
jgi:hypothetical protein